MNVLRKIIDCESLKNSQENVKDGVYFSKVASLLQCTDCTSNINRLHRRIFLENALKTCCLKRAFYINVLIECGPAVHILQF